MSDKIKKIIPHVNFIFAVIFITLLIVDICNPLMDFINNDITKGFMWALCLTIIAEGVFIIIDRRKNKNK